MHSWGLAQHFGFTQGLAVLTAQNEKPATGEGDGQNAIVRLTG